MNAQPSYTRLLVIGYGVAMLVFGIFYLNRAIPDAAVLMETRANAVRASIAVLDSGGPPLLETEWPPSDPLKVRMTVAADDQGLYVLLPYLGHLLGINDPYYLMKLLQIMLLAPLLLVYSILFYELCGSLAASLVAPLVLLFGTRFALDSQLYYAPAWAAFACLPLLLAAYQTWPSRRGFVLLVVAVALGAFATTIRYQAGLPALIAALGIVIVRTPTWSRRLIVGLTLVLAYSAITESTVLIGRYRDSQIAVNLTDEFPTHHVLWHNFYIGLGYLPNPYGIRFKDEVGAIAAERIQPGVKYASVEYENALRTAVLDLAAKDPGFIARNIAAKVDVAIATVPEVIGPLLLLIPLGLFFSRHRLLLRRSLLLAGPFLLINFASPVLYIPHLQYQLGWLSSWAVLGILSATVLATDLAFIGGRPREFVRSFRELLRPSSWGPRLQRTRQSRMFPLQLASLALVCVLTVHVAATIEEVKSTDFYRQGASGPVTIVTGGDSVYARAFRGNLPADWTSFPGVHVDGAPGGVLIETNEGRFEYQLSSQPEMLASGDYVLLLDGEVERGGLYVGVLDIRKSSWLSTSYFWSGQDLYGGRIGTSFHLDASTDVRYIVSNWRRAPESSTWVIRQITVTRSGPSPERNGSP